MQDVFVRILGRPLREIREADGSTLDDLARKAGCAPSTLGNFLKGKTQVSPELLKRISEVLKVPEEEIDNPQPKEERKLDVSSGNMKDGGGGYRTSTGSESGGESVLLSHGAKSTLDHLVEKMDDDQVAEEVCLVLKKKKPQRFEMARYLIKELERRERAGKGGNGHQ